MSFKPLYFERNSTRSLGLADFSTRVESFFHYLGEQDYFPDIGYGTTPIDVSTLFYHETKFRLGFDPFPISNGEFTDNEQLFSFIELLYKQVKVDPYETVNPYEPPVFIGEKGTNDAKNTFRDRINSILDRVDTGFEITVQGHIRSKGDIGVETLLEDYKTLPDFPEHKEKIKEPVECALELWFKRGPKKEKLDNQYHAILYFAGVRLYEEK